MKIRVEYAAQIKQAAGTASESIEVDAPCSVQQVVERIAEAHGEPLKSLLYDGSGTLHPSILLFVRDNQVRRDHHVQLTDNDVVTLLSPISGG